jgi:hypothetical protein
MTGPIHLLLSLATVYCQLNQSRAMSVTPVLNRRVWLVVSCCVSIFAQRGAEFTLSRRQFSIAVVEWDFGWHSHGLGPLPITACCGSAIKWARAP